MTKLHFPAGVPGLSPPPAQRKVYAIVRTKTTPLSAPLCKM